MSQTHSAARGGEFATSRRGGIDPYEIDFITARAADGCADGAIAKMLGRSVEEVRATRMAIKVTPANRNTYSAPCVVPQPPARIPQRPSRVPEPVKKYASVRRARPAPERAQKIIREVCGLYDITWDEIMGDSQTRRISHPRQQAYWRLSKAGFPLADIGRFFEGRDHTSVRHGVIAHEKRLAAEPRHIGEAE